MIFKNFDKSDETLRGEVFHFFELRQNLRRQDII